MRLLYHLTSYFVLCLAFGQNAGAKHLKHLTGSSVTVDSNLSSPGTELDERLDKI